MKRRQVIEERRTDAPRTKRQPRELDAAALDRLGKQTYLDADDACAYLRFATLDALYAWIYRHAVPRLKRGRTLLFLRRDLDDIVQGRYDVARATKERFQKPGHMRRAS